MAGALQSPIAFRAKLPPTTRFTAKSILRKSMSLRSSFSGIKLTVNLSTKRSPRGRGGGAAGSTMIDSPAASYAGALADVAKSNGTLEATCADVEKVEQIFSNPLIVRFFTDPTTSVEKKREILDEIVDSAKIQAHTANFLNILVDMKRIDILDEIVKQFEVVYNKMTNTELAIVTSVVKLDSKHLAQIAQSVQRLTGAENVRIKTVIDPSLVAGFTIRYGSSSSKLIDMSVKKQLDEIATQIDFTEMVGSLAG